MDGSYSPLNFIGSPMVEVIACATWFSTWRPTVLNLKIEDQSHPSFQQQKAMSAAASEAEVLLPLTTLAAALTEEKSGKENQFDFVTGPLESMKESYYQLWLRLPPHDERSVEIEVLLHVATSVRIFVENDLKEPKFVRMGLPSKSKGMPPAKGKDLPAFLFTELSNSVLFLETDPVMLKAGELFAKCAVHAKQILSF